MIVADKLKKTNRAEYLLYMWQVEDILRACKLDEEIMEKVVKSRFPEQSEEEMIENLLIKKKYDRNHATREEQAKMYRFLLQRGFKSSDISHVLRAECLT